MFLTKDPKSPFFQIVYFKNGKRTKKSTKETKEVEAKKVLKQFKLNFNGVSQKVKSKSILLYDFTQEYISYCKWMGSENFVETKKMVLMK